MPFERFRDELKSLVPNTESHAMTTMAEQLREEGAKRGLVKGQLQALLAVLDARGFVLPAEVTAVGDMRRRVPARGLGSPCGHDRDDRTAVRGLTHEVRCPARKGLVAHARTITAPNAHD